MAHTCDRIVHLLAIACAVLLSACDSGRTSWNEEVQLLSGEIVVVKRSVLTTGPSISASSRGKILEQTLTLPDGRATWKVEGILFPRAFEIVRGVPYLAVNIQSRELCERYSWPVQSMVFLKFDGGAWKNIAAGEFPAGGLASLLLSPWGASSWTNASGLIRHKDKHLGKSSNDTVNTPFAEVLRDWRFDACKMIKNPTG
jgi:hypothetical protein